MPSQEHENAVLAIESALQTADVEFERPRPDAFLVTLPGQRKLNTLVWLNVGEHSLLVKTFFCRQPDENHAEFYRWLMHKNDTMYGMAFATDEVGDVYIVGRVPLPAVTPDEVDRLLGCALTYSDDNFNGALERGFASAIRKEWRWRVDNGQNPRNLEAFRHLVEHSADHGQAERAPGPEGR
ncbi:type III secretion system chaperone family protein [Halostreptopolyspora alba]|uniref:YbjN domain-containing protein n=1 Tax=Halostreptopolyspora alba TaxID=2487137 RepID=A0A3N0E872_9ACTN|nr:YbjN domain-containing protein [Nocardiopsaceae bacterium YIM 96095]